MNEKFQNDFDDISSNSNNDLFSYDNSSNLSDNDSESFDLNNFASRSPKAPTGKKKKKTKKQRILKLLLTVFLIGVITVSIVMGSFLFYAFTMVDGTMEEDLDNLVLNLTTSVYVKDEDGNYVEYQRLHGENNRIWVDYDRVAIENGDPDYNGIPEMLACSFIAVEDKRFRSHEGVDWKRTISALVNEIVPIYSSRQGGSTITQQLVKNLSNDWDQKASRKVREIMRARYLESNYSKDTILECYLNTIALGHGIYGVEVAANYYFGKTVNELTLAECASIAGITKSPSRYAPDDNPEENKERQETVLALLYQQGYITKEEHDAAVAEELNIVADERVLNQQNINSYYIDALIDQVTEDLAEKYGYDMSHASQLFYNGGYKIYSTLDPDMQKAAEKVFEDSETYGIKNSDGDILSGSITIMDYSGGVKALVGGIGEKTTNRGFNAATDAIRQPGSTMKPIGAYAPAIENNLITYSTIVNDTKTKYNNWTPKNWYSSYWGNITVQYALERSVNTIPVSLVNKLTPQVCYDFLTQKLGVTTLTNEDINLSPLGMGGTNGGLTTLESAAAYAVFGNGGLYYEPTFYTKVTDQDGNVVLSYDATPTVAISEDTATVMNHLLRTVVTGSNGTGRGAGSYVPHLSIYAKTGTSNNSNDLWFVGGTPYYVASVWCGYETQKGIPSAYSSIALKMWGKTMSQVHKDLGKKSFTNSSYAVERYYCAETGLLATDECERVAKGWYKKNNLPVACGTHTGEELDPPKKNDGVLSSSDSSSSKPSSSNSSSSASQNSSSGNSSSNSSENTTTSE